MLTVGSVNTTGGVCRHKRGTGDFFDRQRSLERLNRNRRRGFHNTLKLEETGSEWFTELSEQRCGVDVVRCEAANEVVLPVVAEGRDVNRVVEKIVNQSVQCGCGVGVAGDNDVQERLPFLRAQRERGARALERVGVKTRL